MRSIKLNKRSVAESTFITVVICMSFLYFIFYRTESRTNWYNESSRQFEILIQEFRDKVGIK